MQEKKNKEFVNFFLLVGSFSAIPRKASEKNNNFS